MMYLLSLAMRLQETPASRGSEYEALMLAVVGIGVVFTALVLIGGVIALLGRWAGAPSAEEQADPPVARAQTPAASTGLPGRVDPATLAVLTAAAYAAVGRPVRVRRVTFIDPHTVSAWKEVGRVTVQTSHNVRRPL